MNSSIPKPKPILHGPTPHLKELQVVVVQYKGSNNQYHTTQQELIEIIELAGQSEAHVVVTPECSCSNYLFTDVDEARRYSERQDGQFANQISQLAQRYQMWCFVGVVESAPDEQLYNSTFIASPSGEMFCYRKRLLFEADKVWAQSGEGQPVPQPMNAHSDLIIDRAHLTLDEPQAPYPLLNVFGWRTTVGICMDLNDIRFLKFCQQAEVELIVFPTNWLDEGHDVLHYWAYLLQNIKRATLLAANTYGTEEDISFCGGSAILQAEPPTLFGRAPSEGDYMISVKLYYPDDDDMRDSPSTPPPSPTDH